MADLVRLFKRYMTARYRQKEKTEKVKATHEKKQAKASEKAKKLADKVAARDKAAADAVKAGTSAENQKNISNWNKMYGPRVRAGVRKAIRDYRKGDPKTRAQQAQDSIEKSKKRRKKAPTKKSAAKSQAVNAPLPAKHTTNVNINVHGHIPGFPIGEKRELKSFGDLPSSLIEASRRMLAKNKVD